MIAIQAAPPAHVYRVALPDCAGAPQVAPHTVVLACADAGITVNRVRWTGWGAAFAAGIGIASVNDCTPSCVAGHVHPFRVVLIALGRQTCPNGEHAYAKITYAWIGKPPYANADPNPTVPYPCR